MFLSFTRSKPSRGRSNQSARTRFIPHVTQLEERCLLAVPTNININQPSLPGNQNESTITIDPVNPSNLFAAGQTAQGAAGFGPVFGAFSHDGGTTWTKVDPPTDSGIGGSDDRVVFDRYENLFWAYQTVNGITVALSTDLGESFKALSTFNEGGRDHPALAVGPSGFTDPGSVPDSLWVTYKTAAGIVARAAAVAGLDAVGPIADSQLIPNSAGGNYTDTSVGPTGQVLVTYENPAGGAGPADILTSLNPDGLGYLVPTQGFKNPIVVPPFPVGHTMTTNVGGFFATLPAQATSNGIDAEPKIAYDRSGGPRNGRVYLAYTDSPAVGSNATEIDARVSDDDGATWSNVIRVDDPIVHTVQTGTSTDANTATTLNDTTKAWTPNQWAGMTVQITGGTGTGQVRTIASNTATRLTVATAWTTIPDNTSTYAIVGKSTLLPVLALDQTTGNVAITWYDTRNSGPANDTARIYGTYTTDGGANYVPDIQIGLADSSVPRCGNTKHGFGDYEGLAFDHGAFYPSWADNAGDMGTSTGGNIATTLNDTTKAWIVNQWAGFIVQITGGTGAGQVGTIASNTATQLTVTAAWTTTPDNTSTYVISPLTPPNTFGNPPNPGNLTFDLATAKVPVPFGGGADGAGGPFGAPTAPRMSAMAGLLDKAARVFNVSSTLLAYEHNSLAAMPLAAVDLVTPAVPPASPSVFSTSATTVAAILTTPRLDSASLDRLFASISTDEQRLALSRAEPGAYTLEDDWFVGDLRGGSLLFALLPK